MTQAPMIAIAPYRFNPLGAHIDHQGGRVLARTLDQYTLLAFWRHENTPFATLATDREDWATQEIEFGLGKIDSEVSWVRYAQAAAATLKKKYTLEHGIRGLVCGTLIGAGLSSSASVILAYLSALAHVNNLTLNKSEFVELVRQVENEYMGLNNGIQDQMSIMYGKVDGLSNLDVQTVASTKIPDHETVENINWLVVYSGFSRELISSGFNDRVSECRKAAQALNPKAKILSEALPGPFDEVTRNAAYARVEMLPSLLRKRASHFFSEVERVRLGGRAWQNGDWKQFGKLMNASCKSSIEDYESGSQPLIDLHKIALKTKGVHGSRFSGGGYGGCLIVLCEASKTKSAGQAMLQQYLNDYPDKEGIAYAFQARPEGCARIEAEYVA